MATLNELVRSFEALWPLSGAESWDSPGLVSGDPSRHIARVLLSVDVTHELVAEAAGKYDLILAHHPFIMRGVSTLSQGTSKGRALTTAIRSDLAIYSAHTNADIVSHGVSSTLASALGVEDAVPLVQTSGSEGHGRVGNLASPTTLGEFARLVARVLPATASGVRVAGDFSQVVQRVAVCGGAGDSFISQAADSNADVYVTGDLRHHVAQDAREQAYLNGGVPALIDVSHWASEWLWLETAAKQLREIQPQTTFDVSDLRTDPFDFVVTQ